MWTLASKEEKDKMIVLHSHKITNKRSNKNLKFVKNNVSPYLTKKLKIYQVSSISCKITVIFYYEIEIK